MLNFFAEALVEEDILGNPVQKDGYTMIMDNRGFHHSRHVEHVLENMFAQNLYNLLFLPPYHPVFNTCGYCFHVMKGWLCNRTCKKHTAVAIYDENSLFALGNFSRPLMQFF